MVEYNDRHPEGVTIFHLDRSGTPMVTSVAVDPLSGTVAIATRSKESARGTAAIELIDRGTHATLRRVETGCDDIRSMAFASDGRLAFSAAPLEIDNPGTVRCLEKTSDEIRIIARGERFSSLCWDGAGTKVFFSYGKKGARNLGYVSVERPNAIVRVAAGVGVAVLDTGQVICLTEQGALRSVGASDGSGDNTSVLLAGNAFRDAIRLIKGTRDISIQQNVKGVAYDLLLARPPYDHAVLLEKGVGMKDYDMAKL